jgi:hypothetical protein
MDSTCSLIQDTHFKAQFLFLPEATEENHVSITDFLAEIQTSDLHPVSTQLADTDS